MLSRVLGRVLRGAGSGCLGRSSSGVIIKTFLVHVTVTVARVLELTYLVTSDLLVLTLHWTTLLTPPISKIIRTRYMQLKSLSINSDIHSIVIRKSIDYSTISKSKIITVLLHTRVVTVHCGG
jgi:hypothetical protein